MKTVINNKSELIINKSKFISLIYRVDNVDNVNKIILDVKKLYKGATHYCYAYIIDNNIKMSDDGEPNGTAGMPILNILQKEDVNHVLCIIVRYFGGVKLGTGGLSRAYSDACKSSLRIINVEDGYEIKINFKYEVIKEIDFLLKNSNITSKQFKENTTYIFKIKKEEYLEIENKIKKMSHIEYIFNILI